jgi:hypothetical protein
MALGGNIDGSYRGYTYRIAWSASQSISGNYSTITCKHQLICGASYDLYIYGRSNSCTVGGDEKSFTSPSISTGGGSTINLGTTTHTVYHNADGTKSVSVSGTFNIQATISGSYVSSIKASGTVTLDRIPRAATITSAPNFTDENNPVLKYSNAAGSAVDELEACIASTDGQTIYVDYRAISETGGSYTFNFTDAEREALQNLCKNAKSMAVRFYVRTKLGGTYYYSGVTKTLTIANAAPTLSPTVKDTNAATKALTGDEAKFIKGRSNAAFTVGAAAKKKATIKSQGVTCGSLSSTAASGTLSGVDSGTFEFSVTDSRGYTTKKAVTKTLIDYVELTCKLKASNPTAAGDMAMTISGSYFNGSFGAVANALTVQYRQSTDGGSTWGAWVDATATKSGSSYTADVALSGLDYQKAYTFQARAVDKLATANSAQRTVRAMPVFDWGEDDFNFNVPVMASAGVNLPNAKYIKGMVGDAFYSLLGINANGNVLLGYGPHEGGIGGGTYVYGADEVGIRTKGDIVLSPDAGSLRPYYKAGDTKSIWFQGTGFVTSDATAVFFTVPLEKPIAGNPTVSAESGDGLVVRQWNNYVYGSSGSTYVKPTSYTVNGTSCGVIIIAYFSDTSGVTNNAPVGVVWDGKLTFS